MDDLQKLLRCIDLEEEEQLRRYGRWNTSSDGLGMSLKQLKAEGVALHPVQIVRKHFGYADYPEMAFRLVYPAGSHQFRDGAAIECFRDGEESVKGILLNLDQNQGEFRLFAPDYPEWIDDEGVGIKLTPDTRTTKIMKQALTVVSEQPLLLRRFNQLHEGTTPTTPVTEVMLHPTSLNARLNDSQLQAVRAISQGQPLTIVHGPPNNHGRTNCHTQVASVGLTEKAAKEKGYELKIGRFPFMGNGKAVALGEPEGLVKTIFDAKTGDLLGAHLVVAEVTELVQGFVIGKQAELTEADFMATVFPHPTLSEMMHESVLDAYGRALHI